MRPQIRIYKYLSLFLDKLDETNLSDAQKQAIIDNKKTVFDYWKKNPDQRLTQMLFNLFNFKEYHAIYQQEGFEYLVSLGVPKRELVLWGSYGKDGKGQLKYMWLDDMTTDHIKAVLKTQVKINQNYKEVFEKEINDRGAKITTISVSDEDAKYGTVYGNVRPLSAMIDEEDCFVGNYLPNIDICNFIDDFDKYGVELMVDYVVGNSDVIFFEITDSVSKEDVIQIMLLAVKHQPDEFAEVSKNVFRLWWD